MTTVVLPTFRRSAFRRLPRSLQAPWGPGMPGTHFRILGRILCELTGYRILENPVGSYIGFLPGTRKKTAANKSIS